MLIAGPTTIKKLQDGDHMTLAPGTVKWTHRCTRMNMKSISLILMRRPFTTENCSPSPTILTFVRLLEK